MKETFYELGRASESELHSLAQGRGLLLEDNIGQSIGTKRDWDEAGLDCEAENVGATRTNRDISDKSHQIGNNNSDGIEVSILTSTQEQSHQCPCSQLPHTWRLPK